MTNMTRQPSVSVPPAPDPRQASVVTEDEVEAMSQDLTDELLLQAARGWAVRPSSCRTRTSCERPLQGELLMVV